MIAGTTSMPITRLADLPLPARDPLELLALTTDRLAPDRQYAGFGWAWVDGLELSAPARPRVVLVRALVLALHGADEQVDPEDVELELELPDQLVRAPLSAVLAAKLPALPAANDLVLAVCNPAHARVALPSFARGTRLHYPWGDVTSWLDREADGTEHVRLSASRWLRAQPRPGAREVS